MASLKGVIPGSSGFGFVRDPTRPVDPRVAKPCANRMAKLEALGKARKGFKGDSRGKAVYLLCFLLLNGTQMSEKEILAQAVSLGKRCIPPLPKQICERNLHDAKSLPKVTDQRIARWLEMSPKEAAEFISVKPARKRHETARRRVMVKDFVERQSNFPTVRDIRDYLDIMGVEAVLSTLHSDLAALNLKNPRARQISQSHQSDQPTNKIDSTVGSANQSDE